jgi:hypothetical protein
MKGLGAQLELDPVFVELLRPDAEFKRAERKGSGMVLQPTPPANCSAILFCKPLYVQYKMSIFNSLDLQMKKHGYLSLPPLTFSQRFDICELNRGLSSRHRRGRPSAERIACNERPFTLVIGLKFSLTS